MDSQRCTPHLVKVILERYIGCCKMVPMLTRRNRMGGITLQSITLPLKAIWNVSKSSVILVQTGQNKPLMVRTMKTCIHLSSCRTGPNILFASTTGRTAVQLASDNGHEKVAEYLSKLHSVIPERSKEIDRHATCREKGSVGECCKVRSQIEPVPPEELDEYLRRGDEGYGTPGTCPSPYLRGFRVVAGIYFVISSLYLVWRALRSLNPGWWYFYSIPFWLVEASVWTMGLIFLYSLSFVIDRPGRDIAAMLEPERFPSVDVYVCRSSEPVEVLEATVVAALNCDYPGQKLCVYILDDGSSPEVADMQKRLAFQLKYMNRQAKLKYVSRPKVKGVPHHAKSGNINHCLLNVSSSQTDYILVLDCDMIIHPTFLRKTMGHFLEEAGQGTWTLKKFAAMLQTPQDFWNVYADDPMVHCARFFYGPMLQGRDGAGACPCCGTGVVFRRDILVSIGGQQIGSITEDTFTSMQLISSGFANMFLNERLVYGMAPEDISGAFKQRLRWAMGAIQILYIDHPLRKRGLNLIQSLLFYEIGAHHYQGIGTVFLAVVPIVYIFASASPLSVRNLWEFCIVFGVFFISNRLMVWWAHRSLEAGSGLELWRGGQVWVWMAPYYVVAILKTLYGEIARKIPLLRFEIKFVVTNKERSHRQWLRCLIDAWPYILYICAAFAALVYFLVMAIRGMYSAWEIVIAISAIAWCCYITMCIWPPVGTLFPRREGLEGWQVVWNADIDEHLYSVDSRNRVVRKRRKKTRNLVGGSKRLDSTCVEGMEGGHVYKIKDLTRNVVATFQPNASDDEDVMSPFDDMQASLTEELSDGAVPSVGRSREMNIGRIAMPRRTMEALTRSALYTSVVLPEPSRVSQTRPNRLDVRSVTLEQLEAQISARPFSARNASDDGKPQRHVNIDIPGSYTLQSSGKDSVNIPTGLYITRTGKVLRQGEEVTLDALTNTFVAGLRFSGTSEEMNSPFFDQRHREQQEERSVTESSDRALTLSISKAEGASMLSIPMLYNKGRSQQIVDGMIHSMSSAYSGPRQRISHACLSQLQLSRIHPSIMEQHGMQIPVVPSNIFACTIASRPSFENRHLPTKTVAFFAINAVILGGVVAGGVLAIFFQYEK